MVRVKPIDSLINCEEKKKARKRKNKENKPQYDYSVEQGISNDAGEVKIGTTKSFQKSGIESPDLFSPERENPKQIGKSNTLDQSMAINR